MSALKAAFIAGLFVIGSWLHHSPKQLLGGAFSNPGGQATVSSTLAGAGALINSNNLTDVTNSSTALSNLGGIGTASVNIFSAVQKFNADTYIGSGTVVYASPNGYKLTGDFGVYTNALCAAGLANASATQVNFTGMNVPTSSFQTGINLATANGRCYLNGISGGGTLWNWGGGASAAITINSSKINNHVEGIAVQNISLVGDAGGTTISTSTPSIGILLGGTNGAAHQVIQYNFISGFGEDIVVATNTYDIYIEHNTIRQGGYDLVIQPANNSTEATNVTYNWIIDPANNNPNDCVLISASGGDNINYDHNATDNCQIHQRNGTVIFISNNKTEDAGGVYGPYIPFLQDASGFSFMSIKGEKVYFGGSASSAYPALFDLSAQFDVQDVAIDHGAGTSTIANLFQSSGSTTNRSGQICNLDVNQFNGAALTAFSPAGGSTSTFVGCYQVQGAGDPTIATTQSNGDYQIIADRLAFLGNIITGTSSVGSFGGILPFFESVTSSAGTAVSGFRNVAGPSTVYNVGSSTFVRDNVQNTNNGAQWDFGMNGSNSWSLLDASSSGTPIPFSVSLATPSNTLGEFSAGTVGIDFAPAGLPSGVQTANASALQIGTNSIHLGNASGTLYGANMPTGFNGDAINIQVNSSSIFRVSSSGFITVGGLGFATSTALTLTSCGSSATSTVGSNSAGIITVGAAATGCTLNFSPKWINRPECTYTDESASITSALTSVITTSSIVLSQATGLSASVIDYSCHGLPN